MVDQVEEISPGHLAKRGLPDELSFGVQTPGPVVPSAIVGFLQLEPDEFGSSVVGRQDSIQSWRRRSWLPEGLTGPEEVGKERCDIRDGPGQLPR
jgi:hypothetical protein